MEIDLKDIITVFLTNVKKQYIFIDSKNQFDFRGCPISSFKPVLKQQIITMLKNIVTDENQYNYKDCIEQL